MQRLVVQDQNRGNVGELDDYSQLDMVLRFNDVWSWSVQLPDTELGSSLATPGYRLLVEGLTEQPVTGPVRQIERVWDEQNGTRLVVSGFSDDVYLWDRIVYPSSPQGTNGQVFSVDGYDIRRGPAETVMKDYVRVNAMAPGAWDALRAVPGLSLAVDNIRGSSVIGRGRLQVLGDMLQALALAGGGLGFRVSDLEFDVYEPSDLVDEAVFSLEVGNVGSYKYVVTAPEATHFVIAGGGQLEDRTFQLGGDQAAAIRWNRRIEALRDRRDTQAGDELSQQLAEEIADKGEKSEVSMRPIDTETVRFGREYFLGDRVTFEGVEGVLTQADITIDGSGTVIVPSVQSASTVAAKSLLRAFDALRELKRRVGNIERNQ